MTDEEYMQQVIKEYKRIDDDPDLEDDFVSIDTDNGTFFFRNN
jgi:hypothetical protein